MKLLRIIARNIRDSIKSVFRNFSLSLASISCITITLLVVSISMLLTENVNNYTREIEQSLTIVVFLDMDITEERRDEIADEIRKLDHIQEGSDGVYLKKKEDIKDEYMESSEAYAKIMKEWNTREDISLRDVYQVKVTNIEYIEPTEELLAEIDGVYSIKGSEEVVNKLMSVFDVVRKGSYAIVIALIIVTAFLITNTIKITIFSRKREIDIMRLVGASNINIKVPFIFEGLFIGILGSIIPIGATMYGYTALFDYFGGELFGKLVPLVPPTPFIYELSLLLLGIGILVGMIGSWLAVRKHLKI